MLIKSQSEVHLHTRRSIHFHPSQFSRPSFSTIRGSGSETSWDITFQTWQYHFSKHAVQQKGNKSVYQSGLFRIATEILISLRTQFVAGILRTYANSVCQASPRGEGPGDEASYTCDKRLRNSILKTLINGILKVN